MRADAAQGKSASRPVAYYSLALLMIAALVSLLDRQILSLLIIPIKQEFDLSDTRASFLQGLSFALFYATLGLPFGYLADRFSRRGLILGCLLFWSMATMACGLAQSFTQLFLARLCVGAGEAGLHPAAYSMMYDLFPPASRGRAYSLFGGAGSLGIALSILLATAIVTLMTTEVVRHAPQLSDVPAWRVAFLTAGIPGLLVAGLLATVKEPARKERFQPADVSAATPRPSLVRFLVENRRPVLLVLVTASMIHICGYGVIAWMPTAFVRTYGASLQAAGTYSGVILLAGALMGAPLGGYFSDRLATSGTRGGRYSLALYTSALGALSFAAWTLSPQISWALLWGSIAFTTQVASATVMPAVLSDLVPNELRGRMAALYLLTVSIVGVGLAPTLVASVTDRVLGSESAVLQAMGSVAVVCLVSATLITWAGRGLYSRALDVREVSHVWS